MIARSLATAGPSTGRLKARENPRGPAAAAQPVAPAHNHAPRPPRPGHPGTSSPSGVRTMRTSSPAGARRRHPTQVRHGPAGVAAGARPWSPAPPGGAWRLLLGLDVQRPLLGRVERLLEH